MPTVLPIISRTFKAPHNNRIVNVRSSEKSKSKGILKKIVASLPFFLPISAFYTHLAKPEVVAADNIPEKEKVLSDFLLESWNPIQEALREGKSPEEVKDVQ